MSSFGNRLVQTFTSSGHLCIGIDPSYEQLHSWGLPVSAEGAKSFSMSILDAAQDQVGIVKPQVAFYEQFGPSGFQVLVEILESAHERNLLVIADAKRGDIGSTMAGYAKAWLSNEAVFRCDALTVSSYLGPEGMSNTAAVALENNRGIFLLAATSNPEAKQLQSAVADGRSVAASVVTFASSFSSSNLGSIGVVVGATTSREEVGISFSQSPFIPVLVPGFGAQGASLSDAKTLLSGFSGQAICSVSRSVAGSSAEGLEKRVSQAKAQLEIGFRA